MKRKYSLIIYCILHCLLGYNQITKWQWGKGAQGNSFEEGNAVAADKNGNVFLGGNFSDSLVFDTALLISGNTSGFIVKYNTNGQVLWAKSITNAGSNYATVMGLATDDDGDVYAVGYFSGSAWFGDTLLFSTGSSGNNAFFLAKYNADGNVLWARTGTGGGATRGQSVATDKNGVYITGSADNGVTDFSDSITVGGGGFIARYGLTGHPLWASVYCVSSYYSQFGVAADAIGNVYATGGDGSVVIAKYDNAGNQLWLQNVPAGPGGTGNGAATDTGGNVYVTGLFQSDFIAFGTDTIFNNFVTGGDNDFFLAKLDANGHSRWAKHATGTGGQKGYSVAADIEGNIYISGALGSDTLTFDSAVRVLYPPGAGYEAMFVATYDENGNVLCAGALASGGDDQNEICADNLGNAFTGGDFGVVPFIVGRDTIYATGGVNDEVAFVAKFSCGKGSPENISTLIENVFLQLHPTPLTTQATVQYILPEGSKNATLTIYDILGRQRNSYPLNNIESEITINANNLSSGIYLYSLVVDGKTLATKKMVVQQ